MPELARPLGVGRVAEVFDWEDGQVLKLFRSQFPRDWVDYETRVTSAAHAACALAPRVYGQVEIAGRCGILLERIAGPSMLRELPRRLYNIGRYGRILADVHARIHAQGTVGLPSQHDRLAHDIETAPHLSAGQRSAALHALENQPRQDVLCHMDFHPDNVLLTPGGPRVIDWMNSCTGSPWADVARTYLMLRIGEPLEITFKVRLLLLARGWLRSAYMSRYLSLRPDLHGEFQTWLPIVAAARLADKIPGEEERLLAMCD
jgi:aminoglycoside phosphotransferase (APT) family kinase protein